MVQDTYANIHRALSTTFHNNPAQDSVELQDRVTLLRYIYDQFESLTNSSFDALA
jgi:hypothetical protein